MAASTPVVPETCARCERPLTEDDRVLAGGKAFCRACYETLREQLHDVASRMSSDVPYAQAAVGAVLGGIAGALLWWGFTVVTHIAFGLLAVAIGFLVGTGAVKFAGGKRSRGLQVLAVGVALVSFALATYLVNVSMINAALARDGNAARVAFPPDPMIAGRVLVANFGMMDVVFLAITLWQAWKIPAPLHIPGAPGLPRA